MGRRGEYLGPSWFDYPPEWDEQTKRMLKELEEEKLKSSQHENKTPVPTDEEPQVPVVEVDVDRNVS